MIAVGFQRTNKEGKQKRDEGDFLQLLSTPHPLPSPPPLTPKKDRQHKSSLNQISQLSEGKPI